MGTRRLEAFSDAIFAIAITLLALTLPVPELARITPRTLAAALGGKWPTYLTFLFSFVTLLIAWVYHHRLLQWAKQAETGLLFTNGLLLLIVSAAPFPTALLGAYLTTPGASVACAVYAGYIGALNFSYNLLWWLVVRQHRRGHSLGRRLPTSMLLSYLGFPCYLLAVGIAFWSPAAALAICGILWIVWTIKPPSMDDFPSNGVQRIEGVEQRMDRWFDEQDVKSDQRFATLEKKIDDLRQETVTAFKQVVDGLGEAYDEHETRINRPEHHPGSE